MEELEVNGLWYAASDLKLSVSITLQLMHMMKE